MASEREHQPNSAKEPEAASAERDSLHELFPLVYEELHSLASNARRRWHGNVTLNATAIVNEAYIKLVEQRKLSVESRAHFLAVAAKAMRQILSNYARDSRRLKRGGGIENVPFDESLQSLPMDFGDEQTVELAALEEALKRLELLNTRQSEIVECRFFGGLSIDETAQALGLSPATVKRDWTIARTWLYREIRNG